MPSFSHLHVHTQFSLLDGAADIKKLIAKAKADNQPSIAITDHGNMFGVFSFVAEANKQDIKPIVGCEFYLVEDRHIKKFNKGTPDKRYHQLFLAKNEQGYRNLSKLCSLGYTEGLYSKWPRIDKELVLKHKEGLIATTCCIGASVPQAILNHGEDKAEQEFNWWLDLFGEDYFIELQRHNIKEQEKVNEVLLRFAEKYNVPVICSNDSHYVEKEDANAHDILLCVNTGDKQSTPKATDEEGGKGFRFGFPNEEFYFKTTNEMETLFKDIPQALDNTNLIADRVQKLNLVQDIMLPNFPIPSNFLDQDHYLEHLSYEGARERYGEITSEVQERINFELHTIKTMGFAGYFLIVADFINAGKDMGVMIGPGRGSAAGSVVAYCLKITNIDPIKYNLLFERFLNPDRKSMPDIDTDFEDEGRAKVIDYVVEKYGKNQVAQIITYGTMAAKTAIQDVARALDVPIPQSNAIKAMIPQQGPTALPLSKVLNASVEDLKDKEGLNPDDIEKVKKVREILKGNTIEASVIKEAAKLEGSVRNTGVHAAGLIIAPKELTDILPVCTAKDSDLLLTQYEGNIIESVGVIKMDFLGLKTLNIIKKALALIELRHGKTIDIDAIPLDDEKTFKLYQKGDTYATFQFESRGMQNYLQQLQPDKFEDLIAMNALYRPGPMEYIPNFVARKHGREDISYDLPDMEEYLQETYGITVYQEQVMLLSQKLAGFTKGQADTLRKAMGKKDKKTLDGLYQTFMDGAKAKGFAEDTLNKIWKDWEAFAQYAFNKSHSTCYAFVAYQTAWLKANYPEEFMAAVLNNTKTIEKISEIMDECRKMGIEVLGPDINESMEEFAVPSDGKIRFGLSGIKGLGFNIVENLISERKEQGNYLDLIDFVKRMGKVGVNKRALECLVKSGALDSFGYYRSQYFSKQENDEPEGIERLTKFASSYAQSQNLAQVSLFGAAQSEDSITLPKLDEIAPWPLLKTLRYEKEMVGFCVSGHPLDNFKYEIKMLKAKDVTLLGLVEKFNNNGLNDEELELFQKIKDKDFTVAGIINNASHRVTQKGKPMGTFLLEDYSGMHEIAMFGDNYTSYKNLIQNEYFVMLDVNVSVGKYRPGYAVNVRSIKLLNDVKEKICKGILFNIPIESLTLSFVLDLENKINEQVQNKIEQPHQIKFNIFDVQSTQQVSIDNLLSKRRVYITPEWIEELDSKYRLDYEFIVK
jgi:DNA polymerase III subunit alpha